MAVKIPAAQARLLKNIFVCRRCSAKLRTQQRKITEGKVKCRNCSGKIFRPIRKKA